MYTLKVFLRRKFHVAKSKPTSANTDKCILHITPCRGHNGVIKLREWLFYEKAFDDSGIQIGK